MLASLLLAVSLSFADDPLWPDLSTSPRVGGGSNDAAVIVAIEDYAFVSDIPGAQSNGLDWYTYMTDGRGLSPSRVTLLESGEASREDILLAVESARGKVRSGGTLWFVFIGHGAPSADGQDGLLLGMDVRQTATSVYSRGLSHAELLSRRSLQIRRCRKGCTSTRLDHSFQVSSPVQVRLDQGFQIHSREAALAADWITASKIGKHRNVKPFIHSHQSCGYSNSLFAMSAATCRSHPACF